MKPLQNPISPIQKSDNDIQNDGQQDRKQTGSHDGKVKESVASLNSNIAGQSPEGNSQPRSQIDTTTDQN